MLFFYFTMYQVIHTLFRNWVLFSKILMITTTTLTLLQIAVGSWSVQIAKPSGGYYH